MPTRTGKDSKSKDDESPEKPAVPIKSVSECVEKIQKMSEDESDTVEDSSEKDKTSDVVGDSTEKAQEMSSEESDNMDVSTDKVEKTSDVKDDSTKKVQEMSGEESDNMDVSTDKVKKMSDVVVDDSTEKAKKMSDVKDDTTKKAQEVSDTSEDSSEKAQKTPPDAGDGSPEEAQKIPEEESEPAGESTEDVLLNTLTSLDHKILLIPVGKNKVGELYIWQPSYPSYLSPPKRVANGSLKWHQKAESGKTVLLDASLAISDDYKFLHAVVDESESADESTRKRVVWRKPTSELIHPSGKGTTVWQARTTLKHSADLNFHTQDLEQRRAVMLVPFNPDVHIGGLAPGSEEGSLSGNQSPRSAEASSEAETSDDLYSRSPKKPRLE